MRLFVIKHAIDDILFVFYLLEIHNRKGGRNNTGSILPVSTAVRRDTRL